MDFAEFIIRPAEGRTRWLYPSYGRTRTTGIDFAVKYSMACG
jgi:hypothetical protein